MGLGAAVVALTLAATSAQAVELVTNGGFSTGDFTGWTVFTTTNGTTGYYPGAQVSAFDVTGGGASNAADFQVGEMSFTNLQEGGGFFQTIHATAGLLTFSADFAAYLSEGLNTSGGVFSVLLDGVVLKSVDTKSIQGDMITLRPGGRPPVFTPAEIERGTLAFSTNVAAGDHVLTLLMTRPNLADNGGLPVPRQFFDNVSAIQAAPAPEPATWALMIAGFGLAGGALRRRTKTIAA